MAKMNSGILHNAEPLTAARIKELEAEVLNQKSGFAYLDENSDLCFALPGAVDSIKELAWDNAYELIKEYDVFSKKAYKKTGLNTFELDKTLGKTSINDGWQEGVGFSWPELTDYVDATQYLEFEVDDEEGVTYAVGYKTGLPSILKFPDRFSGYVVDDISDSAFAECDTLQQVWFPPHVYSIGAKAFQQCPNLTAVYFPRQCRQTYTLSIKGQAFLNCPKLTSVYLPSVRSSDEYDNDRLYKLSINSGAFKGCTALTNIVYGGTMAEWMDRQVVTKANSWAEGIPATYVQCSDGRVDIATNKPLEGSGQEFYNTAPAMLSFRSPEPLDEFNEVLVNGEVVDPSNYGLEEGSTIVKLSVDYLKTLPAGKYDIKVVSKNASPAGTFTVAAAELNEYGFYYNQPYCANVPYLGGNTAVFIRDDGTLDLLVIGDSSYSSDKCTYTFEDGKLVITDRSGVTFTAAFSNAGYSAFVAELGATFELGNELIAADMDYLYVYNSELGGYEAVCIDKNKAAYGQIKTGINGINTVRLANHFLDENKNMTELPVIPGTVTTIGNYAFQNCTSLTHIGIPDGVTIIGADAFNSCSGLESVHFGSGITTIDWYAFAHCAELRSALYNGTVEQWQNVDKGTRWCYETKLNHVQCNDGSAAI